jgi:hypothetical protein
MKPRVRRLDASTTGPAAAHPPAPENVAVPDREQLWPCPLDGYQRLALRVIQQALRDLDCASPDLRQSAHAFLAGNPLLFLWCDLAAIGPARVMARAAQGPPWPHRGSRAPKPAGGCGQASAAMAKLASARSSVS